MSAVIFITSVNALKNIVQQTLKWYDRVKQETLQQHLQRKENWQKTFPKKEMSSPFSSAQRMCEHNTTNCPTSAVCLVKPMHHKQRDALYTLRCWAYHAAGTWLAEAHHHYRSTTEYMQKKSQLKERQTARWLIKVTCVMQNLGRNTKRSELIVMPGASQVADWTRGKTDAGYNGSISIHSACWLTEGRGGRGGMWCTSGCRWLSFIPDHVVAELKVHNQTRVQPASFNMQGLIHIHTHTRTYTHTPTHDKDITKVSPCRNPGLQWLGSRDPIWMTSRLKPHSK